MTFDEFLPRFCEDFPDLRRVSPAVLRLIWECGKLEMLHGEVDTCQPMVSQSGLEAWHKHLAPTNLVPFVPFVKKEVVRRWIREGKARQA